jgi:hypothetical protein
MNYTRYTKFVSQLSILGVLLLGSCIQDEFEQATVTFYPELSGEVNEPNVGQEGTPLTVTLKTSRLLLKESQVNIKIVGSGAGYGYSYVTNPPMLEPGIITLTIPQGSNTASFTFTPKYDGIVLQNDYQYSFTIDGANNAIKSTGQKHYSLTVKEGRLRAYDFNGCTSGSIPQGFTEQIVTGDGVMTASTWACTPFGYPNETTGAVEANAFGKGSGESNSYLVMAPINADLFSKIYINLLVYSRFSGAGSIKLRYSTNYSGAGNPEAVGVIWTDLTDLNAQMPSAGSRVWKPVIGILENVSGSNLYLAIQFTGGTGGSSSNWRVENFDIKAE